jgi:tetratricopeptide (TPR) repeat protein
MSHQFKIIIAVISFIFFFTTEVYATPFAHKWIGPLETLPQELTRTKDTTAKDCQEALLKDPENPALHACVAYDEMKKEQWNVAVKHWKEAIRFSKDKPKTAYFLGLTWTYGKMKRHSAAIETIQNALQAEPNSITLHYWQAALWEWEKKPEKAKKEYVKIISLTPKDEKPMELFYHALGILLAGKDHDLASAEKDLKDFLKAEPNHHMGMILLGQIYIRMKEPDRALSILEDAEAINADHLTLQLLLSQANLMVGKPEPAIVHGKRALHAEPDNITANFLVGTAYLKTGQTEKGIDYLNRVSERTANFDSARLLVGEAYFSEGKIEEARTIFQELVDHNPKDPAVRVSLIRILIATGDHKEAVRQCDSILTTSPDNNVIRFMKGIALLNGNKAKEAEIVFKRIVGDKGSFYFAHIMLIRIYAIQGRLEQALREVDDLIDGWPNHPVGYIMKGDLAYTLGEKNKALPAYNKAVEIDPDSTYIWTKILNLQLEQQEFSMVENLADQLMQKHPHFPEPYLAKGIVSMQKEKVEAANRFFQKVLELNDDHYKAHNYLGLIKADSSKREAIGHYERSLEIYPRQPVIYRQLAELYVKSNDKKMGFNTAKRWADIYPEQGEPYELMAMIYVEEEQFDEAVRYFKKATSLEPKTPAFYLSLGSLYNRLGERGKAIALYEEALRNIPDQPVFLNNLAWHYAETGRLNDGLVLATKAEQKAPDDWNIKDTLGQLYHQKGDYKKALQKYKEASAINDKNPILYYHLAKAYMAIGDNQTALQYLKMTQSHTFPFHEKEEIEKLIRSIEN